MCSFERDPDHLWNKNRQSRGAGFHKIDGNILHWAQLPTSDTDLASLPTFWKRATRLFTIARTLPEDSGEKVLFHWRRCRISSTNQKSKLGVVHSAYFQFHRHTHSRVCSKGRDWLSDEAFPLASPSTVRSCSKSSGRLGQQSPCYTSNLLRCLHPIHGTHFSL